MEQNTDSLEKISGNPLSTGRVRYLVRYGKLALASQAFMQDLIDATYRIICIFESIAKVVQREKILGIDNELIHVGSVLFSRVRIHFIQMQCSGSGAGSGSTGSTCFWASRIRIH